MAVLSLNNKILKSFFSSGQTGDFISGSNHLIRSIVSNGFSKCVCAEVKRKISGLGKNQKSVTKEATFITEVGIC